MRATSLLLLVGLVFLVSCRSSRVVLGPIGTARPKDGVYSGTGKSGPVKVVADVRIEASRITSIDLRKHRTWKGRAAENGVPQRIIAEQSTNVDAVTGATYSSTAIMRAVQHAIDQAMQ
jgi:uncharacterized protein with FMN-binding domain